MTTQYSVIIVEDENEVRARLVKLINDEGSFELVNESATMSDGIKALTMFKPDILLTDLGLPDGSGIDIIKAIKIHNLDTEAMVISGFQDEHIVFKALEAGAQSYLLKYDESQSIISAIKAMMKGGAPMSPVIARLMLLKFQTPKSSIEFTPEKLTERQTPCVRIVVASKFFYINRERSGKMNELPTLLNRF